MRQLIPMESLYALLKKQALLYTYYLLIQIDKTSPLRCVNIMRTVFYVNYYLSQGVLATKCGVWCRCLLSVNCVYYGVEPPAAGVGGSL